MKKINFKFKISKKVIWIIIAVIVLIVLITSIVYSYKQSEKYKIATENKYNMAFYEVVDYVQNVEVYLSKALISTSPEHGAETLTNVWREASLAQSYLSELPISSNEIANTSKFLNQVSDYSYSLSRKNIDGDSLTEEDLKNIKELHDYSVELENTLNQLSTELDNGTIKWADFSVDSKSAFSKQISSITTDSFSSIEENFHEYSGLIYDGAFSENLSSTDKKGLIGDEIDEEKAKEKVKQYYGEENIDEITSNGYSENAEIPTYDFAVKLKGKENATISISKKGGHVVYSNYNKEVKTEIISNEDANQYAQNFLSEHGFENMKETYYLKENGILTINYAYSQNNVTIYPDLIKVKVALDSGEIIGIETSGYLNSHCERQIESNLIDVEKAKEKINKDLIIESQDLAIIPTQWNTEILCWEFKGKVNDNEFLVYINAQTGEEEDILVIVNTPNGTLTH